MTPQEEDRSNERVRISAIVSLGVCTSLALVCLATLASLHVREPEVIKMVATAGLGALVALTPPGPSQKK